MDDYFGIRLDYSTDLKVRITMPENLKIILEAAAEDMSRIAKNPAANHLFTVQEYGGTLTRVQENLF